MSRRHLAPLLVLFAAGCSPTGSFDGRLVDALTGSPLGNAKVKASAPTSPRLACQEFLATTAEDGTFRFDGLCMDTTYAVVVDDPALVATGADAVPGGVPATEQVDVLAWRVPAKDGLYILKENEFKGMVPLAEIGSLRLWDSTETVLFPETLPTRVPVAEPGTFFVMAGAKYTGTMETYPLIQSGRRKFGDRRDPVTSEPWWYLGVEFQTDTDWQRRTAEPAPDKVKALKKDKHDLRYLAGDALPGGHYAMLIPHEKKMYVVNFGPPLKAPGAE